MQFIDLKAQQARIKDKIDANIQNVLAHGKYIMGPEVKELENKLAEYSGTRYAVGVASGTDALLMPLMAHEIGPGDAVFTVSFTFIASAEVIQLLGATPVFVDIEPDTFNMDVSKLEEVIIKVKNEGKLTPKGIIPVDLFGQPCDYNEINAIAKKYGLFVLEDAAQGFGGVHKEKKACSLAHSAGTSFFPAKPLGTYGDGGMVFTNDSTFYDKLTSIRVHGKGSDKYDNIRVGINGRLDTLMAAILLAKADIFQEEIELRQKVAIRYNELLEGVVNTPVVRDYNLSAWAQYTITHNDREKIIAGLKEEGIPSAVYYPKPLHLQGAFKHLEYQTGDFPVSEKMADEVFSLPMYPYLPESDQDKVVDAVKKYAK
ncbi:MAG: DegT/DnrJ/EryC1/StrS aminotransferase family protein [Bacteroidales bacterium]|nr:DegT/DnrJ/EryC1/StrS aminotransferase family protein [Bacteroidales bacterium]